MTNKKLEAIADKTAATLRALLEVGEARILEAWDACVQEAQDNETKPKFRLPYLITLDLDNDKMEATLSWGIKHKLVAESAIPDPSQPDLIPSDPVEG